MKTKTIFLLCCTLLTVPAYAMECAELTSCNGATTVGDLSYCSAGHSTKCYQVMGVTAMKVSTCTKCSGNRTLEKTYRGQCTNVYSTDCVCSNGCTDKDWSSTGDIGYESRVQCGSSCDTTPKYRCAKGYYGSSTNGTSGCSKCPIWSETKINGSGSYALGTTSGAGNTAVTGCYIVPGTYQNTTGIFSLSSNCNYSSN